VLRKWAGSGHSSLPPSGGTANRLWQQCGLKDRAQTQEEGQGQGQGEGTTPADGGGAAPLVPLQLDDHLVATLDLAAQALRLEFNCSGVQHTVTCGLSCTT
jgi:hypothetical protein